jgi:hypothetical protein
MDMLPCKTPEVVAKASGVYLLAYDRLRTVMAVAASASDAEPGALGFQGAKQALAACAPKSEAAPPEQRAGLVDALLKAVAYHRGATGLTQPRRVAKLAHNRT